MPGTAPWSRLAAALALGLLAPLLALHALLAPVRSQVPLWRRGAAASRQAGLRLPLPGAHGVRALLALGGALLDAMCADAWRWRSSHPSGYR